MINECISKILATCAVLTDESDLPAALRKRYNGIANRITLYTPFVPGERDAFWKGLAENI